MFPEPREQAKAIGVYAFVASAGGVDRPAGRRCRHPGDQLALDLLHQRCRSGSSTAICAAAPARAATRASAWPGRRRPGRRADHRRADARRLHDRRAGRQGRLGRGADARARRRLAIILLALFIAREATTDNPLIPLRIFRSRNVTGANLVQVLTVAGMFGMFFMGSLYLQRVPGLRRTRDRARVPAGDDHHGHCSPAATPSR